MVERWAFFLYPYSPPRIHRCSSQAYLSNCTEYFVLWSRNTLVWSSFLKNSSSTLDIRQLHWETCSWSSGDTRFLAVIPCQCCSRAKGRICEPSNKLPIWIILYPLDTSSYINNMNGWWLTHYLLLIDECYC